MTPHGKPNQPLDFDDLIHSYEQALSNAGHADIRDFLPDAEHAQRGELLRELIRIEIEHSWERGQPQLLGGYLRSFPELMRDGAAFQEIAFEEFRHRRQAGEQVVAEDYRTAYGIDINAWPALPNFADDIPRYWTTAVTSGEPSGFERRPENPLLGDVLSSLPEVGSAFLGFQLIAELGRGAFGRVYLARQGDLANRLVALKICVDIVGESQLLAQLQHTNIVPIHSSHRAGILQAVCMPYFGAATLADVLVHLRTRGRLPQRGAELLEVIEAKRLAESTGAVLPTAKAALDGLSYVDAVLWLAAKLADGLAHAHERGIFHRDLKPANVLLTDEGQPMLVDFNLSADIKRGERAALAHFGGTLPYMSPEQLQAFLEESALGGAIDARSDLYALGVILFQLLAGQFPFPLRQGALHEILPQMIAERQQPAPRLRRFNRTVTPAVESIVRKMLHPQPERRYQTAEQLRTDLQHHLNSLPLRHAPEPSLLERLRKWKRRHPRLTSPITFALVVSVLLSAWAIWVNHEQAEKSRLALQEQQRQRDNERRIAAGELAILKLKAIENQKSLEESVGRMRQRDDDVSDMQLLIDTGPRLQEVSANEVARCRAVLAKYKVLIDPKWQEASDVSLLQKEEQSQLRHDVGELLYLLNRETLLDVAQARHELGPWQPLQALLAAGIVGFPAFDAAKAVNDARIAEAVRLNEVAFECYADQPPHALMLQRAVLAQMDGRADDAAQGFRRAIRIIPQSQRDYYLTAYEYAALGQFGDGRAFAKEACRPGANHASWFLLGYCCARTGKPTEAVRYYNTALALRPTWSTALYNRGLAFLELADWKAACADFDAVVSREPHVTVAYIQRARARQALKDYSAAIADLSEALTRRPEWTHLHYRRARIFELVGDYAAADTDDQQLLVHSPSNAEGWTYRGVLQRAHDRQAALHSFDTALRLDSKYVPALEKKATLLGNELGQPKEAVAILNEALQLEPKSLESRLQRGLFLARLGERTSAHEDAAAALGADPRPATRVRAACIYAQSAKEHVSDRDRALELLNQAIYGGYDKQALATDQRLAPLHMDPGFQQLLRAAQVLSP